MSGNDVDRTLRIATRGSALALVQARWVAGQLADRGIPTELTIVRTAGDDRPPDTAWGEGAFVTAIEAALLDGSADVAVHSAKDLPTREDPRLVVAAFPVREDPRDALVCRERGWTLATLPPGSRVGTDSPRRVAFLRAHRPDLRLHALHGNVDSRLAKLDAGDSDALVLAVAGLARLGRADRIDEILAVEVVPPAPGQGALAIQVRADDAEARRGVALLDHAATRAAVETERAFLLATGGGCRSAIGAMAAVDADDLSIVAGVERTVGTTPVAWIRARAAVSDRFHAAEMLAADVVRRRSRARVLLTRPVERASGLALALEERGIDSVVVPAIAIHPTDADVAGALTTLPRGGWAIVTSPAGADIVATSAKVAGLNVAVRWAATGDATAAVLADAGIRHAFVPAVATGAALAAELPVASGDVALLVRGDLADETLPRGLEARGVDVRSIVAYATEEGPATSGRLLEDADAAGPIDAVVLASGSAARGLLALAESSLRDRLLGGIAVCIGATTEAAARAAGYRRVVVAPSPAPPAIADTIAATIAAPELAPVGGLS